MPTDLPPDYKPEPVKPDENKTPGLVPPPQGEDVKGGPNPGDLGRPGLLGGTEGARDGKQPPVAPGTDPTGLPAF